MAKYQRIKIKTLLKLSFSTLENVHWMLAKSEATDQELIDYFWQRQLADRDNIQIVERLDIDDDWTYFLWDAGILPKHFENA